MTSNKNNTGARYSLILETDENKKYYFHVKEGAFVELYEDGKATKSSLQALDFLTANFADKYELAKSYGIEGNVTRAYISYVHKGEKLLAPVFNNSNWAHVAYTYAGSKKGINFEDKDNMDMLLDVYLELADLNSSFADTLLKNKQRLINLSPKTKDVIVCLRAHENAIKMKKTYGFESKDYQTNLRVGQIYSDDQYGFFQDFKKRMTNYREFRTVYLNYCKYTHAKNLASGVDKPKKKVIVPPQQISMFDKKEDD